MSEEFHGEPIQVEEGNSDGEHGGDKGTVVVVIFDPV